VAFHLGAGLPEPVAPKVENNRPAPSSAGQNPLDYRGKY